MTPHAQYYRMRLEDIAKYSTMSLELIQISDVDLPAQWLSDLSSIHTQMEHVSQFLRDQASRRNCDTCSI